MIAYSCSGGPEDRWNYVNGQFQGIGTANGAAMCLDVKGAGVTAGTLVDLWPCGTQANQQWAVEGNQIVALEAGMCLDRSGGPKVGVDLFRKAPVREAAWVGLSPQEVRLLKLFTEGHQNKTAAAELGISIHTVSFHLCSIYEKLHVHTRSEAVARALRDGLIH